MKFDLDTPCGNCPFRKSDKAVRLSIERAVEIASCEGSFPCHKTTIEVDTDDPDDEGGSDMVETEDSRHCAGFLLYREKIGKPSQMMRIAERLGMYDPRKFIGNPLAKQVVDSPREMVFEFERPKPAKKTRKPKPRKKGRRR